MRHVYRELDKWGNGEVGIDMGFGSPVDFDNETADAPQNLIGARLKPSRKLGERIGTGNL